MNGSSGSGLLDWNDARIFLAVARHGSLRAAGRALGISQPTVGRRIAAFEAIFGGPTLFDRLPEGLRLNETGAALLPVAEQLEDAALSLERHRAAAASVLSGTVRISVGEWAAASKSPCRQLVQNPPPSGITLELVETLQTANLARREADLAVRHYPPESGDLYISKLGVFAGAVYRRIGTEARDWVTYPEEQGHFPMPRWVEQHVQETGASIAFRASDMPMQLTAIRAGAGRGILPCFSRTKTRCSNASARRCPKPRASIGSSSTATCGVPRASEPSWTGCKRCSKANAIASPVFLEPRTI